MRRPPDEPRTHQESEGHEFTRQRQDETPRRSRLARVMRGIRLVTGVVVVLALFGLFADTADLIDRVSGPPVNANAIQITQIYAERLFYAVIAIGIAVSIYIATRVADES